MQIEAEKSKLLRIWINFILFLKRIRPSRHNFGWWILIVLLAIIFAGIIRSWFVPNSNFMDPIITIVEYILIPVDWISGLFDKTRQINNMDLIDILRRLGNGLPLTLYISLISAFLGFIFGSILAIILVNKKSLYGLKFLAQIYVDFFRSTPLLVQILIVFFGTPPFILQFIRDLDISFLNSAVYAGTVALALNTAAYQAEIVRGGILAIPVGQTEAARALGLSTRKAMRFVILPQTVRIIVPPLTNELINVILNSSLVSVVGVVELTKQAITLQSYHGLWQVFFIVAIFYFVLDFSLSKITKKIEIKLRIPGLGVCYD